LKGQGHYGSVTPNEAMDLYTQLRSVEINTEKLAAIAATLANGGTCPTNGKKCLDEDVVKSILSVTYACGMKQHSGPWNFEIGLPATYSISGGLLVIAPNVMGLAIYSPRVNNQSICARGYQFCHRLASKYRLSIFDQLVYGNTDNFVLPESEAIVEGKEKQQQTFRLLLACSKGEMQDVASLLDAGAGINSCDYDKRTPLHLACSEGHAKVIEFLLEKGAQLDAKDRWNNSPINDAVSHGHKSMLEELANKFPDINHFLKN